MWPIQTEFILSLRHYRMARYYGLLQQYRLAFLITIPAIFIGTGCLMGQLLGLFRFSLPIFVGAACLIWLLLIASRVERGIRVYMKQPDCLLGRRFKVQFQPKLVKIIVEEKKIYVTHALADLAAVFELSGMYMLYVDAQQTYLVSKEAISREDQLRLRNLFQSVLPDRFVSRFLKK